jgi:hypothetical protein
MPLNLLVRVVRAIRPPTSKEPDAESIKKFFKFYFGIVIATLYNIIKLRQIHLNFS